MKSWLLVSCAAALAIGSGTAFAQAPGTPTPGCVLPPVITLAEPSADPGGPENFTLSLPCPVFAGAVVLVESATLDVHDPKNWSDIVVFHTPGIPPQQGTVAELATMVSDTEDPTTGVGKGITDADLAAAGLFFPVGLIALLPTTVFLPENPLGPENLYTVVGLDGVTTHYIIVSDPPENPVPTDRSTWGRVKVVYR